MMCNPHDLSRFGFCERDNGNLANLVDPLDLRLSQPELIRSSPQFPSMNNSAYSRCATQHDHSMFLLAASILLASLAPGNRRVRPRIAGLCADRVAP